MEPLGQQVSSTTNQRGMGNDLLGICINGIIFFIRKSPFPQNKGADRRPSIHALYTRENVLSLNNPGNIPLGELIAEALNISPEEYHELQQMLDRAMTAWTAMRKITGYGIGSMPTRR